MKTLPQVPNGRFYKQTDGSVISEAEHLARQQVPASAERPASKGGKAKPQPEPAATPKPEDTPTKKTTPEDGE